MALCVWPCNCYEPGNKDEPDLMWDLDLYARLDLADAWAIIGPVNWYGPPSNLKLMFDRLVCMNGGNPREDLIDHKDPEKAMALEHSPEWEELSQNHLEGRTAAFFCYGDEGGDELDASGRPKILRHKGWFDPDAGAVRRQARGLRAARLAVPLQRHRGARRALGACRHGRRHALQRQPGRGHDPREAPFMAAFDAWTDALRCLRRRRRARSSPASTAPTATRRPAIASPTSSSNGASCA